MKELVARVWQWEDARQEHRSNSSRIISTPRRRGCLRRGMGATLIRHVIAEAEARGLLVRRQVLKINPARRPYERLGFVVTGETETHILMLRPR